MTGRPINCYKYIINIARIWFTGCIGKLRRLGIPPRYLAWIEAWLLNRRGFIEINGRKSRWFSIEKGGPQGGVLTPCLFITYHYEMGQFLSWCSSHFFADDLAAIVSGQIGKRFTDQCLDLEKRLKLFLNQLEYYSPLSVQPINFSKTEALFSARAIGLPKFDTFFDSTKEKKMGRGVQVLRVLDYPENRLGLHDQEIENEGEATYFAN